MPTFRFQQQSIWYDDSGGEGFPVVFGHSYLWTASMWAPQVEKLRGRYRCIVPELPGHGRSPAWRGAGPSLQALTELHAALANHLGLERYALAGLSVGGMWAARLAELQADRVAALVLMDTYLGSEPPERLALFLGMLAMVEQTEGIPPELAEKIAPFFFCPNTFEERPTLVQDFLESLEAIPAACIPTVVALGRAIFQREDWLSGLKKLRLPVLVAAGEHDASRPPAEAAAMAELIRRAELSVIPAAGHVPPREAPEAVTRLLSDFLGKHCRG